MVKGGVGGWKGGEGEGLWAWLRMELEGRSVECGTSGKGNREIGEHIPRKRGNGEIKG